MAIKQRPDLDGAMTISQTETECEQIQREGYQLINIQFGTKIKDGTTFLVNKTVFEEKLIGRLEDLHFYEFKSNDDVDDVKAKKKELGWTFICDQKIYARNTVTAAVNTKRVLVFGRE